MSYQVFALKWRPKDFEDLIGQSHIVTNLKSALEKNRLAHAYIFAGPRGVGKTSTARILAKALNCKDGPTIKPCNKCPSCLEITKGTSLDVIEIDGASNRGIDEIRSLRENVKFAPVQGKFKIYIIDEVHMLTTEAFNALLKTLEEPPEFVKFIFATTQPHKVISTILSRCQRFDFRRVPLMDIVQQLEKICSGENLSIDKDVLFSIAKASDGSLRDAESLLDQLASLAKDKIKTKDVISVLGIVEQGILFEMTDKMIAKDSRGAIEVLNKVIEEGKDISVFENSLIEHFRNLMLVKIAGPDADLVDLPVDICKELKLQADRLSMDEILSIFNILVGAQEMSKRIDSLRIPLEVSLVRITYNKAAQPKAPSTSVTAKPTAGIRVVEKKDKTVVSKPAPEPAPKKDEPHIHKSQLISLEQLKGLWQDLINALGKVKMSVATYLSEGDLLSCEGNVVTVSFPRNYSLHKESLETKENRRLIEEKIYELLSASVRMNFVLSSQDASMHKEADTPFMKSVLDTFKGRII